MIYLTTPRFYLRRLNSSDASADYLSWFTDPTIVRFITNIPKNGTLQELGSYINIQNNSPNKILFGIFTSHDNKHIGNIKFDPIDSIQKTAVLGVLIGPRAWRGCGVFREVLYATSRYLNECCGVDNIILGVDRSNTFAIHSYLKSGFLIVNKKTLPLDLDSLEMHLDISYK